MVCISRCFFVISFVLLLCIHTEAEWFGKDNCWIGPDYWCYNQTTELQCNFSQKSIGVCGYSNRRCSIQTGDEFCQSSSQEHHPSALAFNGGLTGVNENLFFYYVLSLYWPPSNCPPIYNKTIDFRRHFCSPYTDRGQPGSERLVLHGLWPIFSTEGNYQGWSQFCTSEKKDWSKCHINGNLCPWANASKSDFTQDDYEYCLSIEGIVECLVNGSEVLTPQEEQLKIFAPGYLNERNLFINHEWTKHGSCCSSTFNTNISTYLSEMLNLVSIVTRPGSLTDRYIQRHVGEKVGLNDLINALDRTATITCNDRCELEEIGMCLGRHPSTGLPDGLMECPSSAQNVTDSCRKYRCDYVYIPPRDQSHPSTSNRGEYLLTYLWQLIVLKYIFIVCGVIFAFVF